MSDIVVNDFSYLKQYSNIVSKDGFWDEVILQLNKDLNKAYAINFPHAGLRVDNAAELIVNILIQYIPSVTPELSEILYRIDLPEEQVNSLKEYPTDIYYRCLCEMIVKREALKVIMRKMYSAKKTEE